MKKKIEKHITDILIIAVLALATLVACLCFELKIQEAEKAALISHTSTTATAAATNCAVDHQHEEQPPQPQKTETEQAYSLGTFKLTAYCACEKCCGKWADGITYSGTVATAGRTIAVDPDVIPLGSTVLVHFDDEIGSHVFIAEDIGVGVNEKKIDIFFDSHADALEFGVQSGEVFVVC